jgi:hypothetical protein
VAYAINHTCHLGFANCKFLNTGITNDPHGGGGTEDEGGVGGRRTSEVFVKATRRVERDADFFANYGTKFRFAGGCVICVVRMIRRFSVNFHQRGMKYSIWV